MSDVAIRVENLGKEYRLGAKQESYATLRDALAGIARKPRQLAQSLAKRGEKALGEDTVFWALKDVSFEIKRGEVVGVIGRNGAGKSTLLKILSRITEPSVGRVAIHGRVGSLLEVGTGFHPELSGRENIFLNGSILGMRRTDIERLFDEIVAFAEVEKFIDTAVKHYSSGMYLRLAFAVAAHLDPEILLVDEVLAVGDVEFQKKCLGKMGEVAQQGRTVLLVSHNLASIRNLCRTALLLKGGTLQRTGEVNSVVDAYMSNQALTTRHEYVSAIPTDVKDTSDNAKCKLIRLRLVSAEDGQARDQISMGDSITVEATIWSPKRISNLQFGFDLLMASGVRLAVAATWIKNSPLDLQPGENVLKVHIDALRVAPGTYSLLVGIYKLPGEHHDFVPDCIFFDVCENDVFGTGHLPTGRSQGLTWFDYSFEASP